MFEVLSVHVIRQKMVRGISDANPARMMNFRILV